MERSFHKYIVFAILGLMMVLTSVIPPLQMSIAAQEEFTRQETLYVDIDEGRIVTTDNWNPFSYAPIRSAGLRPILAEHLFYLITVNGTLVPWLATGYEYNDNYTQLTINLREGVKWSDGESFTADDVVFTYNMLLNNPGLLWGPEAQSEIANVSKVDTYTVLFNLTGPDPKAHLSDLFTDTICGAVPVVPKHIWENEDPLTFKNYPPVFTGPYTLVSVDETHAVYNRRDDWWATTVLGVQPGPKRIVYVYYGTEEQRVLAMSQHKLDCICDISPGAFDLLKSVNSYVVPWQNTTPYAITPMACPRYLEVAHKYPWTLREVRWALSYAINREAIVSIGYSNTTSVNPLTMLDTAWVAPIQDILAEYNSTEYNPSKTEAIFESLNFTRGTDGIWVTPNGTRLEITLLALSDFVETMKIAEVVAGELNDAGIDTVIRGLSWVPFYNAFLIEDYDLATWFSCASTVDPEVTYRQYYTSTSQFTNITVTLGPEFDSLVDQMRALPLDDPSYGELFRNATEIWLRELPDLPLVNDRKLVPFDSYYWEGWPTKDNPYASPSCWCPEFLFILLKIKPAERAPAEAPSYNIWMYVTIGIAVAAVIAIVAVYLRMRKPKT